MAVPTTTNLAAGEVMDRVAALMNDPAKTDYTYQSMLIYLNMAIDELQESLEESNASPAVETSSIIPIPVGVNAITPVENPTGPHYPIDLIEIQELQERPSNTTNSFIHMTRKEGISPTPQTSSLLVWDWENQIIKFNPNGCNTPRDVLIRYIRQPLTLAANENSVIGAINARSYLSFKTGAFCAFFIGEDETRAQVLNDSAERAMERILAINSKGRQETQTRRRPFRAGYKQGRYL